MRTTLTIDDDVLAAATDLASVERKSLGEVISGLARKALNPPSPPPVWRNGIRLLPHREGTTPVTLEMVNRLREELP